MDLTVIDRLLGSGIPYITYAVPFFFLLIGVELIVARLERKSLYRFNDSINDLSCGIIEQVVGIFTKTALFGGYLFIYSRFALLDVPNFSPAAKWAAAIGLFLGVDFCYYWFHRASHEMNAPWAAHAVHHQSEEYNLSVALRQGTFQSAFSWAFYLPLAWIGFPPLWFLAMSSFNTLYQFWIHTRAIGKLGPLEWVLNTPSHHRVHHARNPKYLDKNHAGTLIIWDRMFGTFQAEEEEPVYGLTKPLASWNPVWANLHLWAELFRDAWLAPRWIDKLKIWIMPPGWRPDGLEPNPSAPEITREEQVKYDPPAPRSLKLYVLAHFVVALVLAVVVLNIARMEGVSRWQLAGGSALVIVSLLSFGGLLEQRRWSWTLERVRVIALAGIVATAAYATSWFAAASGGVLAGTAVSLAWLGFCRGRSSGHREAFERMPLEATST